MPAALLPANERERLEALYALRLLDTPQEERFDVVTRLAAELFGVPIAFVSLIDRERQWFKSTVGLDVCESSREQSFCAHAILQEEALVIPDTLLDARFAQSVFVTAPPHLRFYAGQPLRAPRGEKVGTLCIADTMPHEFPPGQVRTLQALAAMVERELRLSDLIDAQGKLLAVQKELLSTQRKLQEELGAAAEYLLSQLPPPIEAPIQIDWRFIPSAEVGGDGLGYHALDETHWAVYVLDVCGHGVAAALMASSLLSRLRSQALGAVDFRDPAAVLAALNREFPMSRHGQRFFTIWYGVVERRSGKLVYGSAGHPPAFVLARSGTVERLTQGGIAIGCIADARYHNEERQLEPGEILYVYSDGAVELKPGDLWMAEFEQRCARLGEARTALDTMVEEMRGLVPASGFLDDVTILRLTRAM